MTPVPVEGCGECGFDGAAWTDDAAVGAIAALPDRWVGAVEGLADEDVQRRPIAARWSIAEYTDHVRETLFGMRFVLDLAVDAPGTVLGDPPAPTFDPDPRAVDVARALGRLREEAEQLHDRLATLTPLSWASTVAVGDAEVDAHWIARHAVHDATHHLNDVELLRARL